MDSVLALIVVCAAVAVFAAVRFWLVVTTFDEMITHSHH
jgi:hypothetical protein